MGDTIFGKILHKEIPCEFLYEDDLSVAFKDINPVAPVHFLVIPKEEIPKLSDAKPNQEQLLGHLLLVAQRVARQEGIPNDYRVVINNGAEAGQTVFHLRLHGIVSVLFLFFAYLKI